jgi:hypothetical protein
LKPLRIWMPRIDELVFVGVEVGAAVEEVGDSFAMAEVDEGGKIHGDGAVGKAVRAGGVGGGEKFGDGGFGIVAAESYLAESLVGEEDGIAVAGVAGEVGDDLDEFAGVRLGGVELIGGVGLAEGGGETKETVGFVRAGEELGEGAGGEGGAFGVFGSLGFRG